MWASNKVKSSCEQCQQAGRRGVGWEGRKTEGLYFLDGASLRLDLSEHLKKKKCVGITDFQVPAWKEFSQGPEETLPSGEEINLRDGK